MRIAIVSGKGGAGKTTVATRLFRAVPGSILLDCDVEEPNAALFLRAGDFEEKTVSARYPSIDEEMCTHCGACASFCTFGALLNAKSMTIVMAERCHDCGGCDLVCPVSAVTYAERPVGKIVKGRTNEGVFAYGELNVGEFSGVRLIKELKSSVIAADFGSNGSTGEIVWIDGPPGTGCAAAEAVEDANYVVLVTEPTPFGASDMAMAAEMLVNTGIPFGVAINKDDGKNSEADVFCREQNIPILGRIPFDRGLAESSALGRLEWGSPEHDKPFLELTDAVLEAARKTVTGNAQDGGVENGGAAGIKAVVAKTEPGGAVCEHAAIDGTSKSTSQEGGTE